MPHRWLSQSDNLRLATSDAQAIVRWSRLSTALALVIPALLFALVAAGLHRSELDGARERLDRAARVGQEHAARVVETNHVIAQALLAEARDDPDATLLSRRRELHEHLVALTRDLRQVQSVWLWDADGHPLASNLFAEVPRALDVSDREYFRWARDRGTSDWFITRPLISRTTGEAFVDFTRRRSRADGSFAGVLSVSLFPSYFHDFYGELAGREPALSISLVRSDGALISRWPDPPPLDASLPDGSAALAAMAQGSSEGLLVDLRGEGPREHLAYRRVGTLPLYVLAKIDHATVLAGWYRRIAILGAFVLPLAAALAYATWLAMRRAERERLAVARFRGEVEQRMIAEEARRQGQKLEALGQITGGVAHDFNNLLMVVNNNAHLMRRTLPELGDNPQLAAILRAVDAGSRLTRQLLAFARRQPLQPSVVSLHEALPELLELMRTVVGRSVQATADVGPDVAAIEVDRAEFELALINLAVNARDAMPAQGGSIRIVARNASADEAPECSGRCVAISVSDTGHGIAPEIVGRVFEPFFTTKGVGQGTGLGLAQVYGFAVQSRGAARIHSEPGKGTTVTIYLPAGGGAARERGAAGGPGASRRLSGCVLLVEDNDDIAQATIPLLHDFGCRVVHVGGGEAAMRSIEREPGRFDAVLSDVVMPGVLNGLDLALELRRRHPTLPVVLMSGYAAELHRALAEGFVVLPKPCSPDSLSEALGRVLPEAADARGP